MKSIQKIFIIFSIAGILLIPVSAIAGCEFYESASRAYLETAQTIGSDLSEKVLLNAETYDEQAEFDIVNSKFTPKMAGYYRITGQVYYNSPIADKYYRAMIYKNGISYTISNVHTSNTYAISPIISDLIYLDEDDYIELYSRHNAGENQSITNGEKLTFLTIHKIDCIPVVDEIFTLIESESTDAEFYLAKTINYGDIALIVFLSIFTIATTCKWIGEFVFKKDDRF